MQRGKPDLSCQNKFISIDFSRHKSKDVMPEEEVTHDLKQKEKLDKSAAKIADYLATKKEKLDSKGKPVKSNITDPDSAKMTTSKGTIPDYNGIAINDDKHQIIVQAQTWGSVGEQQTLKPAITQLEEQLKALGTQNTLSEAKFTADSGFHSEENLKYVATTGLNSYMVDAQFRSRNPIFKISETYHTEKEKRRFKRSKGKPRLFTSKDFHYDKTQKVVAAQQGMKCGVAAITSKVQCALTHDLWVI